MHGLSSSGGSLLFFRCSQECVVSGGKAGMCIDILANFAVRSEKSGAMQRNSPRVNLFKYNAYDI